MPLSHSTSADTFVFETEPKRDQASTLFPAAADPTHLAPQIAIASIATHLILIAWFGGGVPPPRSRPHTAVAPTVTVATVENVQLTPEPPLPVKPIAPAQMPIPDAPPAAADLALPPLSVLAPVAAVPASVPVAFGIQVKGPVRLVGDASTASGSVGGHGAAEPLALDLDGEKNLVLPTLRYPPRARHLRLTGTVVMEFQTNQAGDIFDVRIRSTSGHALLDEAAKENLQAGRWRGRPGLFLKAFEFTLQ
jgi:TonB family protein